jgi:hypothetical protein
VTIRPKDRKDRKDRKDKEITECPRRIEPDGQERPRFDQD